MVGMPLAALARRISMSRVAISLQKMDGGRTSPGAVVRLWKTTYDEDGSSVISASRGDMSIMLDGLEKG